MCVHLVKTKREVDVQTFKVFIGVLWATGIASDVLADTRIATDIGLSGINVVAATTVNADANAVWATLTDYNRLASYVPGMTMSRLVSAPNAVPKLLEQQGEGGLASFVMPDHVVFAIYEKPKKEIGFRSTSMGATMRGQWEIRGTGGSPVVLVYRAQVIPLLPPPPILTDGYVQGEVKLRMEALAKEAERRMQTKQ